MSLRDIVIFCAGMATFHAISHGVLYLMGISLDVGFMKVTPTINLWATVINGLIAAGLLGWAHRLSRANHSALPQQQLINF